MIYINSFTFSFITGVMFGIEFLFEDDLDEKEQDGQFKFGVALDLGIFRILFQRFAVLKD